MTTQEAISEMMTAWNKIEGEAKKFFPNATKEELYQICKNVMNKQLGFAS